LLVLSSFQQAVIAKLLNSCGDLERLLRYSPRARVDARRCEAGSPRWSSGEAGARNDESIEKN